MKTRFALIIVLGFSFSFSKAQESSTAPQLSPGYYIVVAAYHHDQSDFASNLTRDINQKGQHAQFGLDATRNLVYVYLEYYTDFNQAIQQMLKVRGEGSFPNAWVRVMKGEIPKEKKDNQVEKKSVDPIINEPVIAKEKTEVGEKMEVGEKTESGKEETNKAAETKQPKLITQVIETPVTESKQPVATAELPKKGLIVYQPALLTNAPVFLSVYNPTTNNPVPGEIEVVDTERSKLLTKAKGNDFLKLPDPKSKSGKLTFICNTFGYRKQQHELNYKSSAADTLEDFIALEDDHYTIKFEMVRLHRGDIATLYNVYFYNDAAVMLPASKYELNNLLKMMTDNPAYRIRLHGHTNGKASGVLIKMGEKKNFFELTSDVKKGVGTAKALSGERAQVIKDWLQSNGIAPERVEVKAWGGKRMIYDKNGPQARKNVRVEVEILDE